VIPTWDVEVGAGIPAGARFWMPSAEALQAEEGGIGYFHDTWVISDVARSQAGAVVAAEAHAIDALNGAADDPETFERLAEALEFNNGDFPSDDPEDEADLALLTRLSDSETPYLGGFLGGLEVGVAGLSHALGTVGCVPAASCRAHTGDRPSWADEPVVFAAIDREHADWLQPLVQKAGCGFGQDLERPEFLTIYARSIRDLNALAAAILTADQNDPAPPLRPGPDED
jgi:hypothetical protein